VGLGLIHYIPPIAYFGFWVMCLVSLSGRPLLGLYYLVPFLPYRTMRDHFLDYPLGGNVLTILVFAVIVGALIRGKHIPKSKLYLTWLVFGIYLYFSMWFGTALGNAPAPIWISDVNFAIWKDYMLIPLVFLATGLVVEDRKAVRTIMLITACALLFIDRSCLLDSLSHSWGSFDENKRSGGPLGYGSNQTAAFLAQFAMFFWGVGQFVKRIKIKVLLYGLVALTLLATMYTFSRASYIAVVFSVFVLGLLKDRKLLLIGACFLMTWQVVVPTAVRERVNMTEDSSGHLEASAEERVRLWQAAEQSILNDPIFGAGYATYGLKAHVDGLRDTHNWYVKVVVETGVIGLVFVVVLLAQLLALPFRLFRTGSDPLYKGLGLGLFLAVCACIVANFFGDRWTYLEITGLLWVNVAAAVRALEFSEQTQPVEAMSAPTGVAANPYLAFR